MGVPQWLERTELLIPEDQLSLLQKSNVLIVGLGGVGSFAAEFIARAGVGKMTIVDGDIVDVTNINRQLQAVSSTIGMDKADLISVRLKDINPDIQLTTINKFLLPEDMHHLLESDSFDFVLDCIDSITPKLNLIIACKRYKINLISSMGAGGKLDPSKVMVSDISLTRECKFAQAVRKRLKKDRINKGVKVVYSCEIQKKQALKMTDGSNYKRSYYGTCSYMPALFGLTMASEVIRKIAKLK